MQKSKVKAIIKKVYSKPKITEVRLVAAEAVLGFCKDNNALNVLCASKCNVHQSS